MLKCKEGQGFEPRRTFLYIEAQIRSPDAVRPVAFAFGATGTPHFSASTKIKKAGWTQTWSTTFMSMPRRPAFCILPLPGG